MEDFHEIFEVEVSEDHLKAVLKQRQILSEDLPPEKITAFLNECGITYGIDREKVKMIAEGRADLPAAIATGKEARNGENAYIKSALDEILEADTEEDDNGEGDVDLKKVIDIPSVEAGTVVGRKIDVTAEENGVSVFGKEIKARPGRDIKLRPGKNTRIEGSEIIAMIDGQVSAEPKVIHVFPVFEVNGDLNMKTGNIDFIGNVNIRGNVPSGFSVKAKGDIRVHGSVEAAELTAGGSVFIHQGVVAQGGGLIKTEGDVHTSFLNQSNIEAEGDVYVTKSVLQSKVEAGGFIFCKQGRGNIVGGTVSAGKGIEVNETGNHMSTPTDLFLGISEKHVELEKKYKVQAQEAKSNTQKLGLLLKNILQKEKKSGLSAKEKVMKLRIKNSLQEANELHNEAADKLEELSGILEKQHEAQIRIYRSVYPNTTLHFGKYKRKIITKHEHVMFRIDRGEIKFESL